MVQVSWASEEALNVCCVLLLTSLYFPRPIQASVLTSQEEALGFSCLTSVIQTPFLTPPGIQGEWGQVPALKCIYRQGSSRQ